MLGLFFLDLWVSWINICGMKTRCLVIQYLKVESWGFFKGYYNSFNEQTDHGVIWNIFEPAPESFVHVFILEKTFLGSIGSWSWNKHEDKWNCEV